MLVEKKDIAMYEGVLDVDEGYEEDAAAEEDGAAA